MLHPFITQLLLILLKIICLLVAIAYYTIAERKIMAAIQRRRGPNVVGFWGLLQPLADGLKLVAKEMVIPSHSNSRIFVIAPLTILTLGLLSWSILPFGCFDYSETMSTAEVIKIVFASHVTSETDNTDFQFHMSHVLYLLPQIDSVQLSGQVNYNWIVEANDVSNVRYGLLVILALSSLTVYGLIIAGWASNSKYAFLGALRSAAQMISYEVSISLVIIPVIAMAGSLNFTEIVSSQLNTTYYFFPLIGLSIIFFISMIAETNRTPFDLPEAEAELVAGYNIEYSSIIFAMFFLAEYGNMIMMSLIKSELFIGGWGGPDLLPQSSSLAFKALIFCFAFVLVRATFPRYRYDQLMNIGWKIFLPVSTGLLLLFVGLLMAADGSPVVLELWSIVYSEPQLGGLGFNYGETKEDSLRLLKYYTELYLDRHPGVTEQELEPEIRRVLKLIEEKHDPRSPAQIKFDNDEIERKECARLYAERLAYEKNPVFWFEKPRGKVIIHTMITILLLIYFKL